jgi:hypothetical protein
MWTTDKQPVCGVAATVGGGAGVVVDVVDVVLVVLVLGLVVVVLVLVAVVVLGLVVVVLVLVVVEGAVDVVVDEVEVLVVGSAVDVPATPVGGEPCCESLQPIITATPTPSSVQPARERMRRDNMAAEPPRAGHPPGLVDRVRAVELTHACLHSPTVPV